MRISDWSSDVWLFRSQTHLDRGERAFEFVHAMFGGDAGLDALVHPFVFAAPIDVAFRLKHIGAAAAEAEHGAAHALDRDIAGQDEQVGPAALVAIILLDRPHKATRHVGLSVFGSSIARRHTLLRSYARLVGKGGGR